MNIKTTLIEFGNDDILRGILVLPKNPQKVVVMSGGFERSATTEKKFKSLADELTKQNVASFRFDYTGIGLSDGDFSQLTIKSLTEDWKNAIKIAKQETKLSEVSVVAHSLSTCTVAGLKKEMSFDKIVFIAPALNQRELLRYWFTVSEMKKSQSEIVVDWDNFQKYLDEEKFLADCRKEDKMTKVNYISTEYFLENQNKNYAELLSNVENILHIHGDSDNKVPLESLSVNFPNQIIIKDGDHDLENPNTINQWLEKAVIFLTSQGGKNGKKSLSNS